MNFGDWFYAVFVRWPRSVMWLSAIAATYVLAKLAGIP